MKPSIVSRINAVLLTLASMLGAGGAAAQAPETAMPDLDTLELRYFDWRVEYGEALPADAVPRPWRALSVSAAGILNINFWEGALPLTWYGNKPPADELAALKNLVHRLLREHAAQPWPGSMEKRAFDKLEKEQQERLCTWVLNAAFGTPGKQGIEHEIRLFGSDTGANPARLAFETPLAEHAEKLVRRLYASAPKALDNLFYTSKGEGSAFYALSVDEDGQQVNLSRQRSGQDKDSSEVTPALATRVADIVRKHGADGWNGFAAPDWNSKTPGSFELSMRYNTGQQVWARGLRGQAAPEGHAAFERELLAALDEALDGPPGTPRAAPRQGLKSLHFSEGGMSYDSHIRYHVRTRREAGRDVFHLMHKRGPDVRGCPMSDEDVAALEALLVRLEVSRWNGFSGNAPGVLDGTDFGLSFAYTDGREVSARGSNRFPDGYRAVRDELIAFFDALLEQHK